MPTGSRWIILGTKHGFVKQMAILPSTFSMDILLCNSMLKEVMDRLAEYLGVLCRHGAEDVERPRPELPCPSHDKSRARSSQVVPISVKDGVLEKGYGGLETHFGEGTGAGLQAVPVEGHVVSTPRHVVGNQVEMAEVD